MIKFCPLIVAILTLIIMGLVRTINNLQQESFEETFCTLLCIVCIFTDIGFIIVPILS